VLVSLCVQDIYLSRNAAAFAAAAVRLKLLG
jgi:hypothetical protein